MLNKKILAAVVLSGVLGAGSFAATPAAARDQQRCDRYGCWTEHCEWRDHDCHRVAGSFYTRHHYYSHSSYDRDRGYWDHDRWEHRDRYDHDRYDHDRWHHRHWVCNEWGHDCHWHD